jgi:hypothetical protein
MNRLSVGLFVLVAQFADPDHVDEEFADFLPHGSYYLPHSVGPSIHAQAIQRSKSPSHPHASGC